MTDFFNNTITYSQTIHITILFIIFYVLGQILTQKIKNPKSDKILTFLLILFLIFNIISTLITFKFKYFSRFIIFLFLPSISFIAPIFYIYILSLTKADFKLNKKIYRHLIAPSIFLLVSFVLNMLFQYYSLVSTNKDLRIVFTNAFFTFTKNAIYYFVFPLFLIYAFVSIYSYRKHVKEIPTYFSYSEGVQLKWIRGFIIAYTLFILMFILSNIDATSIISSTISDIIYYSSQLLFLVFIGYFGAQQVNIYAKKPTFDEIEDVSPNEDSPEIIETREEEIISENQNPLKNHSESFFFNEKKKIELKESLLALITESKPYKLDSLTIDDLSNQLKTNKKYLSHIINEYFNKNFYNFINEYRIQEAIQILGEAKSKYYSVEGIGNLVGFKSKSSFYTAFKKVTGMTPNEYKMQMEH